MEITLIATRTIKSSGNVRFIYLELYSLLMRFIKSILLKTHALQAIASAVPTSGKAITDAAIKDLMKQLRSCLTDKSMALQRAAAEVNPYCSRFLGG
jgi:hypothetical protein